VGCAVQSTRYRTHTGLEMRKTRSCAPCAAVGCAQVDFPKATVVDRIRFHVWVCVRKEVTMSIVSRLIDSDSELGRDAK
jgi:hypothetical protein